MGPKQLYRRTARFSGKISDKIHLYISVTARLAIRIYVFEPCEDPPQLDPPDRPRLSWYLQQLCFWSILPAVVGLRFNPKKLGLLVLVCVMIWTQWAAAAELCPQAHAPNDYCAVCHLGVLPFLKVAISVTDAPALLVERLAIWGEFQSDRSVSRTLGVSRAPPSNPDEASAGSSIF